MKQTISLYQFRDAFAKADSKGNFSYTGLEMLFEYFEQYEEDCGVELELDAIAICCEYSQDHWEDIAANYDIDLSDCDDDDEKVQAVREYLDYNTMCVGYVDSEESFIYAAF